MAAVVTDEMSRRLCECGHRFREHNGGDCIGCKGCTPTNTILDHPFEPCDCPEYKAAA